MRIIKKWGEYKGEKTVKPWIKNCQKIYPSGIMKSEYCGLVKEMKKYTLQDKIKKTYSIVFVAVLVVTTIVIYLVSSKVYWDKSLQLCEQLVNLNLELLNDQVVEVQNRQEMLAKDDVVKEVVGYYDNLKEKDYGLQLQYQRQLNERFYLFGYSDKVSAAYILDRNGKYLYFYKESPKVGYNMLEEDWYTALIDGINMDTCYVSGIHSRDYLVNDTDEPCISIVRPVQGKDSYTFSAKAYLVCDIILDSVFDSKGNDNEMQFAVLDKNDRLYAKETVDFSANEKVMSAIRENDNLVEMVRRGFWQNSIVVSAKSRMFGWKIIGIKDLSEIADMTLTVLFVLAVVLVMMTILVAYLSKRVAGSVLQPMHILVDECNQVAGGDYGIDFKDKPSMEISILSDTIRDMVNNVVKLSEKVVEEERKLSDEKLRVLQHQINPHFLNNVLQTIKALAVAGETEKVSRITTLLGHILAYSVYEPYQNVEVQTELEYLENYIELQNIRYDNLIICTIECEEEAGKVLIPKLTFQPLVENAIEHGLKDKGRLVINISTDLEPDRICMIISDNGTGIAPREVEELEKCMANGGIYTRKGSIGLVNVNERLQRMFGKEYGIRIHSKYNYGTTVIIDIPRGEA